MQKLATGKNEFGNARAAAGELPAVAAMDVHAAAVRVPEACAGRGEGCGRADGVACWPVGA